MPMSFSVRVAAEESGLSERTIHAAIKDGRLKALRIGRRVLIKPDSLREYLDGKTVHNEERRDASTAADRSR